MTDKQLSDNEMIKALEYCEDSRDTDKHCLKCPYCNESYCLDKMMADALFLINRQKAEIERLQSMNNAKLDMIHDLRTDLETTKSEAIKEFAERLKGKMFIADDNFNPVVLEADIDNLVKEMVGDGDDR